MAKPSWLRIRPPSGPRHNRVRRLLRERGLHTVCEGARCPNVHECWGAGTVTFMVLGEVCTRSCRFCSVTSARRGEPLDDREPEKLADAVTRLSLTYVVLTSVDRDDLPDGGAEHFARCVEALKRSSSELLVEVLIPDFAGSEAALRRMVGSGADVIGHNLETVRRLTPEVRDRRCRYELSLQVLGRLKKLDSTPHTKSSLMVGMGEREAEVAEAMRELRAVGVDIITLGQYLQPTRRHRAVAEYVPPESFERYAELGRELGFLSVASGPLVRSSYRAGEHFLENVLRSRRA